MLNQVEKEQIEKLEQDIASLRDDLTLHRMIISGLLNNLFQHDPERHSTFFSSLRTELDKLPVGSIAQQESESRVQEWIDAHR